MSKTVPVTLNVNGVEHHLDVEPRLLLVHALRDHLGLTGTHVGCDTSNCGACTIHMDGKAVKSCTVLAVQADGAALTTIEGMASENELHPLQEAFWNDHGLQCGYCTPGMIMAAAGLLAENPNPTEEEVRHGLEGNLCRCTGYHNIVKAVLDAAKTKGASVSRAAGGDGMSVGDADRGCERNGASSHVGPVAAPQGGPATDHRPRQLRRRHQPGRPAVGGVGALARGAREDRLDRHLGGQGARRRLGGLHQRGSRHGGGPADGVGAARGRRSTPPITGSLAKDEVKHVGDPVALVIGDDRYAVVDAAEDVVVEYDPLPVVTDPEKALEEGSALVHEKFGTNKVCDWSLGGGDLEAGFAEADVIIERRIVNHRMAGGAIEPRGVLAEYRGDRLTVWSSTQVPHFLRLFLAILLGVSEDRVRVIAPEVGGGFGSKLQHLRRGDRLRVGGAQARASGEVDRDALRGADGDPPRARPDRLRQGRRQARRHAHRVALEDHRRRRRLPVAAHAADPAAQRVRDVRGLQDAGRRDRRDQRAHEQVPDRRDPGSRPARGDPHDRGRDGPACATSWGWTRWSCGARTSSHRSPRDTRRRSASCTTPGTTRPRSTSCSSTSTRPRCARRPRRCASRASTAASVSRPTPRSAATRRRGPWVPPRSGCRAAAGSQPRSGSTEPGRSLCTPARPLTARVTRRGSRRSSRTGSGSTRSRSR